MTTKRIPVSQPAFIGNEKKYVMDCMDTGWVSSIGKYVNEFETKFAAYIGSKYAVSCCNGTVALHLALMALGVAPGDEVIMPTLTYIATANAVKYCGAKPVFVDSEPETWNIDPALIAGKITKKTKGIIVVHLYGHPVDMDPVMEIAKKHNLWIIEDAAEAHGALYKGKMVGSFGDIATFSFFGNKVITTGEGGMVVTNNSKLAEKVRLLKGQGMDPGRRYWFPIIGYNYRMTNIQAAIGLAQLENIQRLLEKRRTIASLYHQQLGELKAFLTLTEEMKWARHSYWMYSILLKDTNSISRDRFMEMLGEKGIETRPLFYPMHVMPPYKQSAVDFPVSTDVAARGLNLPTYSLLTEEDIKYIAQSIKGIIEAAK
jgi:perosamine synthetase